MGRIPRKDAWVTAQKQVTMISRNCSKIGVDYSKKSQEAGSASYCDDADVFKEGVQSAEY